MAKSSRSKWKKLHRRQKAKEESTNTVKRIKQLNHKLGLTIKGGISAVPPQEPERRFHFLNPELDPRVPNTRKDLNNNYRAELNHVHYDYTKPLKLAQPKTNLYGKSDTAAPHPMTVQYDSIDADAPIGGHALTKADMERMARRQMEKEAEAAAAAAANANEEANNDDDASENEDEDGPEEFVFGMTDAAPRRAVKSAKKTAAAAAATTSKKESGSAAPKAKKGAAAGSSTASSSMVAAMAAAAAAAEEDVEDDEDEDLPATGAKADKITSMQAGHKKNGVTVSASGGSKMKKVGGKGGSTGTRVVSSGGKAAQKKTANKKVASK